MFANCQAGGVDNGFPNVCLVPAPPAPPIPTPMPCIGNGPTGVPAAVHDSLLLRARAQHGHLGPNHAGWSPGNSGCRVGHRDGEGHARDRGVTCLVGGKPVTRMTTSSVGNMTNCPPTVRLAPSQTKILILAG